MWNKNYFAKLCIDVTVLQFLNPMDAVRMFLEQFSSSLNKQCHTYITKRKRSQYFQTWYKLFHISVNKPVVYFVSFGKK